MPCNCTDYIDCGDPKREGATSSGHEGYTHKYNNTSLATGMPYAYSFKVSREFKCNFGWDRTISTGHVVVGDCSPTVKEIVCDSNASAKASCTQSEDCAMEINVPYYIDRQRDIFVWKNIKEELKWSVDSGGKVAKFKLKFGAGYFHKILVKNTVKTVGSETFLMSVRGVISTLATHTYEYNPFPATEGGGATWGLYGNTIQREENPSFGDPSTDGVAMILLFPLVGKQAIPQDNDVIRYGFYDYNSIEGGFTESSLPKDDGGKDHFYPAWLRAMPSDSLWTATASDRYDVINSKGKINLAGTSDWYATEPITYPYPFGSLVFDSKDNFIASMLLQFGARCDNKGIVYNKTSFGDLFKAMSTAKLTVDGFVKFDPISLL